MNEADLRQQIEEYGLSQLNDVLVGKIRPTIYLRVGQAGQDERQTRIGGVPDLPEMVAWPTDYSGDHLTFALQINLQDIPRFAGNPFPERGLLSVFVGMDEPATDVTHAIFLFPDVEKCLRRDPPSETVSDTFSEVQPHHLTVTLGVSLPFWATNEYSELTDNLSEDEQDAYSDLSRDLIPEGTIVRLLGHAAGIGSDPREDAYVVREVNPEWLYKYDQRAKLDMQNANHWQHLLTIDSDDKLDLGIWDAGYLQFLIKDTDLAGLNFAQVYAAVESS